MSEATNVYSNLSNQKNFILNEINKIKDYFNAERKIMTKKLSKHISPFDYLLTR